ncbi:CDP-diacylglycerol--inositol 3-phosphatidyltransferase 1, partial [Tetrabaena socialis]
MHKPAVLWYIPNIIGYGRIALLVGSAGLASRYPQVALGAFLLNFALDGVDGAVARRLGQTSSFGAFLDVAVDVATRGLLWWSAPGGLGLPMLLLEALTFVCTHAAAGEAWKSEANFSAAPGWVQAVMANGFWSPAGVLAMAGLQGCPLWVWAQSCLPGTAWSSPLLGAVLVPGRLLAAAVELWVMRRHMGFLLRGDAEAAEAAAAASAAGVAHPAAAAP